MKKRKSRIRTRADGSHIIDVGWVRIMRRRMRSLIRRGDYEQAHGGEDMIHQTVLREISRNTDLTLDQIRKLATAALRTQRIPFPRTCGPWEQ